MPQQREPVSFLVFSASLRAESLNTTLAKLAARSIEKHRGTVDLAEMKAFDSPSYSPDAQAVAFPAGATELRRRLEANDGFVVVSPEYNGSMPGLLKNVIDWVSRFRPQPFNGKDALLLSASPSMAGGNRGLWALRMPLEHLGTRVYPDMFSLAQAHQAFDPNGNLTSAPLAQRLDQTIAGFMDLAEAAKYYPCAKTAWVEFLGEQPNSPVDRVDRPV
ncbi:MAG: NADPH-dependent FMN reductase [Gemmatimonadetes bacterium]|nr:MAG: NADPH-dependent FMN reductase [Gemmatimonadota bacterium]